MRRLDEPLSHGEPAPEPPIQLLKQPSSEKESVLHTIHVLDHDSEILLFLFDFLSNAGYQLSASSNAGDALEHVARSHPEILIADLDMPGWTGSELLMRVRQIAPSTRVIVTSGREEWPSDEMLWVGHCEVLKKPINGPALLRILRRLLIG
jgi:DNA-binding NtrC family response regulator